MTENAESTPHWEQRFREIASVFVLSITAVLTAWCGFQSSKWGGEMSIAFSQASGARIQAADYSAQARDARQFDLTIYAQWVVATAQKQEVLAGYIEERFTPAFKTAFEAWRSEGMQELGPFARAEYVPGGTAEAADWSARADERFASALENNQRGDNYSLLTVLFALVLFLTALSQRKTGVLASRVYLGLAAVAGAVGVVIMLTFPVRI